MAITLDIARDNPNAHTVSAEAVLPGEDKPTLIGLSREELGEALGTIGVPQKQWRMRASQLWHWLWFRATREPSLQVRQGILRGHSTRQVPG